MTKDEALALALHALHTKGEHHPQVYEAIYAIQTVLAQPPLPEQEPVAFYHPRNGFYWAKPTSIFAPTSVDVERLPLYTAVQRKWVGLTYEEIESAISDGFARGLDDGNISNQTVINYVRGIEAKLKELNNG